MKVEATGPIIDDDMSEQRLVSGDYDRLPLTLRVFPPFPVQILPPSNGESGAGNVLKTTICKLVANPDSFDGKMIELRGDVFAGLETNVLYDGNCRSKGRVPDRILFDTTDVPKVGRTFLTPDDNTECKKFWNLVGAYKERKGKRRSIVPDKYTVTATVTGRFDALTASHAGGKLVLKSVRDVVARQFDESFMAGAEPDKLSSKKKKPH
jgi:hypothetical protein